MSAKAVTELLASEPRALRAQAEWEVPRPLAVDPPTWVESHPPARVRAWRMLVPLLERSRAKSARGLASRWPVAGERAWPAAWIGRALGSADPPIDDEVLACADAIDLMFTRPKVSVGQLRKLFRSPALQHVVSLWFYSCRTPGKWVPDLARSPHVGGLRFLNLHGNRLDGASVQTLAQPGVLPALERLDVGFNALRGGLPAFLGSLSAEVLPALRALDVGSNGVSDQAFVRLADSGQGPIALRHLDVSGNKIGAQGLTALVERWAPFAQLERLRLGNTPAADQGLRAMASCGRPLALRSIECRGLTTGVGAETLRAFIESPHLASLEAIELGDRQVLGAALLTVFEGVDASRIRRWGLARSGVGPVFDALVPHLEHCEELDLSGNAIRQGGLEALFDACPRLRRLDITSSHVDAREVVSLLRSPHADRLEWLALNRPTGPEDAGVASEMDELAAARGVALVSRSSS